MFWSFREGWWLDGKVNPRSQNRGIGLAVRVSGTLEPFRLRVRDDHPAEEGQKARLVEVSI